VALDRLVELVELALQRRQLLGSAQQLVGGTFRAATELVEAALVDRAGECQLQPATRQRVVVGAKLAAVRGL